MRVMFDISPIGFGLSGPLYRSGVFRYVQQIAIGLATSDEVELTLSAGLQGWTAGERFRNLEASLQYRESDNILRKVAFPYSRTIRSLVHIAHNAGWKRGNPLSLFLSSPVGQRMLEPYRTPHTGKALRQSDIFHSPACALPESSASITGLRRFLTVHDMLPVLYPHFFEAGTETAFKAILDSLRPNDWMLCDSESTRNDLCDYLKVVDRSRIFVALLAADPCLFYRCNDKDKRAAARKRYNIPEGPYVLSVCSVDRRKNLDHVIRCFTELVRQEKIEDLCLVLVGPVALKSQEIFNQIINSGEVRNRIILTGYVSDEDLAAIYSDALMFVYPSLCEGFGLPPLEAMQCGVPVITSNSTSLPEVVGDAGILVDPRDRDGLCSSMLRLYQSPSLREAVSELSVARSSQFSWQRCVSQTLTAYRTALSK